MPSTMFLAHHPDHDRPRQPSGYGVPQSCGVDWWDLRIHTPDIRSGHRRLPPAKHPALRAVSDGLGWGLLSAG